MRFALRGGTGDVCYLEDDGTLFAMTAGTVAGRALWQDVAALGLLIDGDDHVAAAGGATYKPTAAIVARDPGHYVAMAGPDAAAPPGKVGVWTDGGRRGAFATRSASGRTVRLIDEGDGMVRTNLLSFYSAPLLSVLAVTAESTE